MTYINAFTAYALIRAPRALMPPLPIKNVQKAHADCDDARHQKCGGQNMLNHGNASFVADTSSLPGWLDLVRDCCPVLLRQSLDLLRH